MASSALQDLLRLIATITVDDLNGTERCGGGGFGDVYGLAHAAIGKLALKRMRISGNQQEIDAQCGAPPEKPRPGEDLTISTSSPSLTSSNDPAISSSSPRSSGPPEILLDAI